MAHEHASPQPGGTIAYALALIKALDAEQQLAAALEPLYPVLREGGHEATAERLTGVQHQLRECLVEAGQRVNTELERMAAAAPTGPES